MKITVFRVFGIGISAVVYTRIFSGDEYPPVSSLGTSSWRYSNTQNFPTHSMCSSFSYCELPENLEHATLEQIYHWYQCKRGGFPSIPSCSMYITQYFNKKISISVGPASGVSRLIYNVRLTQSTILLPRLYICPVQREYCAPSCE